MKTTINATLLALTLAFGSAYAADTKPITSNAGTPGMIAGDVVKAEAEVIGIDKKTRTLTLKGEDGNVFDVVVGKEAKNFKQIKVGDRVVAIRSGRVLDAGTPAELVGRHAGIATTRFGVSAADPAPITARSKSPLGAQQSSFMGSSVRSCVQPPLPPPDGIDRQRDEKGERGQQHGHRKQDRDGREHDQPELPVDAHHEVD